MEVTNSNRMKEKKEEMGTAMVSLLHFDPVSRVIGSEGQTFWLTMSVTAPLDEERVHERSDSAADGGVKTVMERL